MRSDIIIDKFGREVIFDGNYYILKDENGNETLKCSSLFTLEAHAPSEYISEKNEPITITEIDDCLIKMIENQMFSNNETTEAFIKQSFKNNPEIDFIYILQKASSGLLKNFFDISLNVSKNSITSSNNIPGTVTL
jgi:hypothetical protein